MKEKIFALVDCNNFSVSCERVFHAALCEQPVMVMSNNDGCVIARSNEVKKLGVSMGQPVFQIQELIRTHHIHLFSSNFSLYGNMSARVMAVLRECSPRVEVYSIDEAFLDLTELASEDLTAYGRQIKERVLQSTGIPVSVGIARTKTLAKIAAHCVKKSPEYQGVLDISALSKQEMDRLLSGIAAEDIWGIGRQYSTSLKSKGIFTARDIKDADATWMRKKLTVVGERMVLELRGISCLPLETMTKPKKEIMRSKSFRRPVKRLEELGEAVANYTARCAEKLRKQESLTTTITVSIRTSLFTKNLPQYSNALTVSIPYPTSFTPDLVKHACTCLEVIYKEGYHYHKAGVSFSQLVPDETIQPDLFADFSLESHYRQMRLMAIVDAINEIYGRDTLFLAVQGRTRGWKMRQSSLSGRFTTEWSEILTVGETSSSFPFGSTQETRSMKTTNQPTLQPPKHLLPIAGETSARDKQPTSLSAPNALPITLVPQTASFVVSQLLPSAEQGVDDDELDGLQASIEVPNDFRYRIQHPLQQDVAFQAVLHIVGVARKMPSIQARETIRICASITHKCSRSPLPRILVAPNGQDCPAQLLSFGSGENLFVPALTRLFIVMSGSCSFFPSMH